MADNKTIIIDLDNSLYAHAFTDDQQIHQEDLVKALEIIRCQLQDTGVKENSGVFLSHLYRTIGVFGDRGSGKTSFMVSLLTKCQKELKNAEVLRMIDPTLVEHKKPIILSVISMIQRKVEFELRKRECQSSVDSYQQKRKWDKLMEKISSGLVAIDKVGKDFDNAMWQDEAYVMHTGLAKVMDSNDFEENLRKMISEALRILDKDAFILAFDDIDVDVEQGWQVLESLRRYLSDVQVISIVSGNIKLYGTLVRNHLVCNLNMAEGNPREMMANELESQYMLKLLNPSNRINLLSLGHLLQKDKDCVKVKNRDVETELVEFYYKILNGFGIQDKPSLNTFVGFLLSMSLRSQIHFMKDASEDKSTLPMDVFSSRLYASGIDVEVLVTNAQLLNIVLLGYLNAKKNLPDCYLLMPTLQDKDVNSNFTALTLVECWHLKNNPFLVFDYMLRIGYVRNVVLPLGHADRITALCKYAGWYQFMSLKNNVGLTMAYMAGKENSDMNENIRLFAMEEKAKKGKGIQINALDKILKDETNFMCRLMAMFPFMRINSNKNNESRSYYSFIALLAVVGDILKCADEEEITGKINDLKLFRSYQMPQDGDFWGEEVNIDGDDYGVETISKDIENLANKMWHWKEAYKECFLPPYALGRMMTRLYSSLSNVAVKSVGDMMNIMVANFFNACLIEETRIRIPATEQSGINNSNLRSDTRYFKDNLGKVDIVNRLPFTKWMMACPMLYCFLDKETYSKVQEFVNEGDRIARDTFPVYDLLCKMSSKNGVAAEDRPSFSGEKVNGWKKTAEVLRANGIIDDEIQEKIINEADNENAVNFIKGTNLFRNVSQSSVKTFKENYQNEELAEEEDAAQVNEENPDNGNE